MCRCACFMCVFCVRIFSYIDYGSPVIVTTVGVIRPYINNENLHFEYLFIYVFFQKPLADTVTLRNSSSNYFSFFFSNH